MYIYVCIVYGKSNNYHVQLALIEGVFHYSWACPISLKYKLHIIVLPSTTERKSLPHICLRRSRDGLCSK